MAEVKYEDYKLIALAELVTIDRGLNAAAIGLSDKEAREKKLWLNKDKLPSEKKIRDKFQELKPGLQKKLDREERRARQEEDSAKASDEFDELFDDLYAQDEDLGLTDKQLAKLSLLLNLNKKDKALKVLKRSKLINKGE